MATGAPRISTLQEYVTETYRVLRDPLQTLYSQTDVIAAINRALRQRDLDLPYNRLKLRYTLTAGQAQYDVFTDIVNGGTVLAGNPAAIPFDFLSIIVMPLGGVTSAVRYPLARWPYTRLHYLLSPSYPTYPVTAAFYGSRTLVIAPPPAQAYPVEFDFCCHHPDLVNMTDQDSQQYPFSDPVPFLAAHFLKVGAQRYDEADYLLDLYATRVNLVRQRVRPIQVAQPWADLYPRP